MSRTEDRLADALTAAARAVPEETLRPLVAPQRRHRHAGRLTPLAAALAVVLVAGLAVALGGRLFGSGRTSQSPPMAAGVPRYYVETLLGSGRPVVRSTATGTVTATVPIPVDRSGPEVDLVSPAQNGTFFVIAFAPGVRGQRLYRFRLTSAGQVTGFVPVPGEPLGGSQWAADAIAASPDGSQIAVAFKFIGPAGSCGGAGERPCPSQRPDFVVVVNTATGAKSIWRNGTGQRPAFSVASLSWTGHRLVFLGQWCRGFSGNSESCGKAGRVAEVRSVNLESRGGRLDSGPVLLRESARFPYLAQGLISPDGETITAIVLRNRVVGSPAGSGTVPDNLSVEQISVSGGKLRRVLYQRHLGSTFEINGVPDFLALNSDASGKHWLLNVGLCVGHCTDGLNGWLHDGRLVPLEPVYGRDGSEAW
jgi:hypothetical protein